MRAPSLLAQCLPGLLPHDKSSYSITTVSEKDSHLASPAVEIIPSKVLTLTPFINSLPCSYIIIIIMRIIITIVVVYSDD